MNSTTMRKSRHRFNISLFRGARKKHQQTLPVLFFFVLPPGSYKSSMGFLPVEGVVVIDAAFE